LSRNNPYDKRYAEEHSKQAYRYVTTICQFPLNKEDKRSRPLVCFRISLNEPI